MNNIVQNPQQKVVITFDGKETFARIYEDNKVVAKGVSQCHPDDEFDIVVGSMTALTRAAASLERSRKKPQQEWVVVHRKPRAGDYVRLKEAWFSFDRQGDILKVVEASGQAFTIRACEHPNYQHENCNKNGANFDWCYPMWRVEVVEPAPKKPEYRKITREPKVGDYVKIGTSCYIDIDKPGNIYKIDVVDGKCIGIKHCNHPAMKKWYKENDCEDRVYDDFIWWYSTVLNKLEFLEKV